MTATTLDEHSDVSACEYGPLSGTLSLVSGDDEAVLTFDGETDCDDNTSATWTLNGDDQGTITGVGYLCATTSPRGLGWLGLSLLGLGLFSRRDPRPW